MVVQEIETLQREYWLTLMNEYLFESGVISNETRENILDLIYRSE